MTTFIMDSENSITALTQQEVAAGIPEGATVFTSDRELAKVASDWPAERLVEIWNGIPGVKPVTRFTSRKAAASRIWKAVQQLAPAEPAPEPATKKRGRAKQPKSAKPAKKQKAAKTSKKRAAREGSKQAEVLEMLRRKGGCTLPEIMKATGWQAHTVRGFISGTVGKKLGIEVKSTKNDSGERTYAVTK